MRRSVTNGPLTVWDPVSDSIRTVTGLGDLVPWPSTITTFGPVFPSPGDPDLGGVYGTVDSAGLFHRGGTVPTDLGEGWSPDGRRFAYRGDGAGDFASKETPTTVMVLDVATRERHRMKLPPGVTGSLLWESPETLLVNTLTGDTQGHLVRCHVSTGACEVALRLRGGLQDWYFPMRF